MKKVKIFSWLNFILLYLYAILLIAIIVFASINTEQSNSSTNIIQILVFACLGVIVAVLVLGLVNLLICLKHYNELIDSSFFNINLKIKLGLIPFFIINFIFWAILWLGTLNVFLILIAPIIWIVSLFTTYLFLLIEGTPNIVFLVKKFFNSKDLIYLIYGILHFIYVVDIVGALLAFKYEKRQNSNNLKTNLKSLN